jgi:N-acetylglutamate synthase-like GNAT family acetyltransferase
MIRLCQENDIPVICQIINESAQAYDGVIPADCYRQPYMSPDQLKQEMKRVMFYGWEEDGQMVGVMGIEPVKDVTLIRHSYVLPDFQGRGIGKTMLKYLKRKTKTSRLLVGTWADASWAISFYRMQGFQLMPDKDNLLKSYWDVSPRQIEKSVVMGMETGRR